MGGLCGSNVKQQEAPKIKQVQQAQLPDPPSKYSMVQPTESPINGTEMTAMIVSEGLAYNFLVKQGVKRQKSNEGEGDCVFLYSSSEEKQLAQKYHQIGLIPISNSENQILEDGKTARVLFNFKTIWIFRDTKYDPQWLTNFILRLDSIQVKLKQINFYPRPLSQLVLKYNLLDKQTSIINSCFPLQVLQSGDIVCDQTQNNGKEEGFNIYLHGISHVSKIVDTDLNLYSQCLGVRNILFLFEAVDMKITKTLEMKGLYKVDVIQIRSDDGMNLNVLLKIFIPYLGRLKQSASNLLLVHDVSSSQVAFEAISEYLKRDQFVHKQDIDRYLDQRKAVVVHGNTQLQSQIKSNIKQPIQQQQQFEITKSRCEEMKCSYEDLNRVTKSQLASQSVHKTMLKLLENIIANPTDPKYRTIQASNRSIQLNLTQYKEGLAIMKLCGFLPSSEENNTTIVNNFEVGMLKLCRGDLELAFKQSSGQ